MVTHYTSDLTLALLGTYGSAPLFPVFHSKTINIHGWSILLEIIGESHRIMVKHKNSDFNVTEILACLPSGSEILAPLYEGKLSEWESKAFERDLKNCRYTFNYKKLNFSDKNYESTVRDGIKAGRDIISYDFDSLSRDGNLDIYGPTTVISIGGDDHSVEWVSLHGYPHENASILSHSHIVIK